MGERDRRRAGSGRDPREEEAIAPAPAVPPPSAAGNAALARFYGASRGEPGDAGAVLARKPKTAPAPTGTVTLGPAIWGWNVTPRARPVEATHLAREFSKPDQEGVVYKDDEMWVDVAISGITDATRAEAMPMMMTIGSIDVAGSEDPVFTGSGFRWKLRFGQMGRVSLAASVNGPDGPESWDRALTVYGDLTDYRAALERTSDLVSADILDAGARVDDAAAAYKVAYDRQKAVLDQEAKDRQMVEDLLWNALFAGIGGAAGGAVGNAVGSALGNTLKATLEGGAAIDTAKDVTKSLVRGVVAMGKPASSIASDPELRPMAVDPLTFLTRWSATSRREGAFLLRQLAKTKDLAAAAENEGATTLFSEDPYTSMGHDPGLQFLKGPMSSDPGVYGRALWEAWLAEFGYEFVDEHYESLAVGGDIVTTKVPAMVSTGVSRDSKLEDAIIAAAVASGFSEAEARAWYEGARAPAKARAEAQLAQRRAGITPTPHTPGKPDAVPTGRDADAQGPTGR